MNTGEEKLSKRSTDISKVIFPWCCLFFWDGFFEHCCSGSFVIPSAFVCIYVHIWHTVKTLFEHMTSFSSSKTHSFYWSSNNAVFATFPNFISMGYNVCLLFLYTNTVEWSLSHLWQAITHIVISCPPPVVVCCVVCDEAHTWTENLIFLAFLTCFGWITTADTYSLNNGCAISIQTTTLKNRGSPETV